MINIEKLLESKRVEVTYAEANVDKFFVRNFRKEHQLTQVALANILGVTKKAIEKWEQGANNVNGSSAVLLRLLSDNPELLQQVYSVKHNVTGKPAQEEYTTIESKTVTTTEKGFKIPVVKFPFVAMF